MLYGELLAGAVSIAIALLMVSEVEYRKIRNPILLLITALCLVGAIFRIEFVYAVLILNLLYLVSPPFAGKLGKYF